MPGHQSFESNFPMLLWGQIFDVSNSYYVKVKSNIVFMLYRKENLKAVDPKSSSVSIHFTFSYFLW